MAENGRPDGEFDPIARESVVSEVARRLLDYLTSGSIKPGSRLPPERQLATSLGVGRSTIREALAALDLLGIVKIRPGSGSYLVGSHSDLLPQTITWGLLLRQARLLEMVEARQFLEVICARLAAERATPEDVVRLGAHLDAMRVHAHDLGRFVDADVAFHLETAVIGRNSVLSEMLSSVRSLLQVWVERAVRAEGSTTGTLEEHTRVFEAIRAGDPAAAEAAMHAHMDSASRRLRTSIGDEGRS